MVEEKELEIIGMFLKVCVREKETRSNLYKYDHWICKGSLLQDNRHLAVCPILIIIIIIILTPMY